MNIQIHSKNGITATGENVVQDEVHLFGCVAQLLQNEELNGYQWLGGYSKEDLESLQIEFWPANDEQKADYAVPDNSASLVGFMRIDREGYGEPWFVDHNEGTYWCIAG